MSDAPRDYAALTIEHLKGSAESMVELAAEGRGRKAPVDVIDGVEYEPPITALAYGVLMHGTGGEEYERWLATVTEWIDSAEIMAPNGRVWTLRWTAMGVLTAYPPPPKTPEVAQADAPGAATA
jgi:hypothetical protein